MNCRSTNRIFNPRNPIIMKTTRSLLTLLAIGLPLAAGTANQNLILPNVSDGSDLALNAAVSQSIQLPPDGRLNYTTINIPAGVSITFLPNAANTPVYLLAQGDVTIDGSIDVSGKAGDALRGGVPGPGGFAGGMPGVNGGAPGDGLGPGAGLAGSADGSIPGGGGAYGTRGGTLCPSIPARSGQTYGSQLLLPLVGGSGGGGGQAQGAGGGGGAILVASSTKIILNGAIYAYGGPLAGTAGGGSGGAVRLLAPTIAGTGSINVIGDGGALAGNCANSAGAGRVRCDMVDRSGFQIYRTPDIAPVPADPLAMPPTPALLGNIAPFTIDQYLPLTFPPVAPALRVVSIGTILVPQDAPAGYTVTLPLNAAASQQVVVQASGFGTPVPVALKLTPASGAAPAEIHDTINDNSTRSITANFPPNTPVTVNVWTR